ncbi:tyrosine-type recombinase/integrase [Methylobacterium sp. WL12]|uniref:tyrosine-type recombinase/integrase n=1 Tax=Methylobacterium sp. WL12 TaxID=2603890 RepID=UPI0011CA6033|nr:tyrosine-type recombinase/integrase [Methylobacterium sp. WL12]TXM65377.1 tyrosine-type recombinase/integrase [Methylobacterium sp. WL12]
MARPKQPARLVWDDERKSWEIRDTIDGKRFKRRTGHGRADRSAAEGELALHIAEQQRLEDERQAGSPDPEDPANSNPRLVSVAACLGFYGTRQEGTANGPLAGQHIINLLRHWKGKTLAQVRGESCRAFVKNRTAETYSAPGSTKLKPISISTARRELQSLSAAIGVWHREYALTARPIVSLPEAGAPHPDWLTLREYDRLLKAAQGWDWTSSLLASREPVWERVPGWHLDAEDASDHLERFCEIGFYSATRAAAILDQRWTRTLDHGWMDLNGVTMHRSGPRVPKTRKRQPPCRIHDKLLPRLRAWREADLARGIEFVVHENGAELQRISRGFAAAARRAGLDRRDIDGTMRIGNLAAEDDIGMPTPHVLRHSRVTLMLRAGVPPIEVAEYAGMSLKMVLDVYGHHHAEYQQRAAAA